MYVNKIKTLLLVCAGGLMASCSNEVNVGDLDESRYEQPNANYAFLTDQYGNIGGDSLMFNNSDTTKFFVNLSQTATSNEQFTISYDESALTAFNTANGTNYAALPSNLVTIDGNANIASGKKVSEAVKVVYKTDASLETNGVYALPLSVKPASGNVAASEDDSKFVLLVRDISKMPNAQKSNGLHVISCFGFGDCNPLNNLLFTLKSTGQPLFDQVILFSSNINYNPETGQVYVFHNESATHIFNMADKYLKPLRQKGIKVLLGVLGNWDRSGISDLSDEGARLFAKDVKANLDAYGLDGVFYDDEYSSYGNYPGFETASAERAARLCYETKKAIGDRLVETYTWRGSILGSMPAVDGHDPGDFVDFGVQDYLQYYDLASYYPNFPKSHQIQASSEFAQGRFASLSTLQRIVSDNYGGTMVFTMDPFRGNFQQQLNCLQDIARAFYNDDLVYAGNPYAKDW